VLGWEPDEVVDRAALSFLHPDDVEVAAANLVRTVEDDEPEDPTLVRVRHRDGRHLWFEIVGGVLAHDPALAPAHVVLTLRLVHGREERHLASGRARRDAQLALRRSEERFRALVLHATDDITVIGPDGTIEHVNPDRGLFGPHDADGVEGRDGFEFIHPADAPELERTLVDLVGRMGETIVRVFRVQHPTGQWRWVESTVTNMLDNPDVRGLVANSRDVTERVHAERNAARLLEVLEATEDLIGVCDPVGRVLHLNGAARRFAGIRGGLDEVAAPGDWLSPLEVERLMQVVLPRLEQDGHWSGEISLLDPLRREVPMLARFIAHRGDEGATEFYSWIMHDIADRKAAEDRLAHQARHDALTGLANRSVTMERLTQMVAGARAAQQVAVLFVDLDDFKEVNDQFGHAGGDTVLARLADRLREIVRPGDHVGRFGGDEFVVVLHDLAGPEPALEVAERVTEELSRPLVDGARIVTVGASVGVACTDDPAASATALLAAADAAMYEAKSVGRAVRLA
jgi:diguanylate cyclase (GGDEF)-like protein/PAS domain S-box-containing protein